MKPIKLWRKNCLFAGLAGKKDDNEKFDEQFGERWKLGNHDDSTCSAMSAELLQFRAPKSGDELIDGVR